MPPPSTALKTPCALVCLVAVLAAPPARAQAVGQALEEKRDEPRSGSPLAAGVAVFPGLILPGAGHLALGETEAAKRFLVFDGVGMGLLLTGLAGLAGSGGSDKVAPFYVLGMTGGISLLSVAWLSDILGSAHGSAPWARPWEPSSSLAVRAGYTGLFASQLDFRHGIALGATWRYGRFQASPSLLVDPAKTFYGLGADAGLILWQADDAVTRVSLAGSLRHHRFRYDRYSTTVGEVHGELRLNLGELSRTLQNGYLLTRLGVGLEAFAYDAAPFQGSDLSPILVLEVGGGVQVTRRVNVELLYRNRKDELPGGVTIPGIFDSFLGFFELQSRVLLTERFSVLGGVRWGSGLMPWISIESQLF